ncbi:MAG: polyprenyl synthetase family protein [Cyanobacteria bacterium P01_F01_bin.150]
MTSILPPLILQNILLQIPLVDDWPDLKTLLQQATQDLTQIPYWQYPCTVSEAIGGSYQKAAPAAASILVGFLSIHLMDDLLDEVYHRLGSGTVANLAAALQGISTQLVNDGSLFLENRLLAMEKMQTMTLETAYGQHLDMQPIVDEADYWRVARAKTAPLFKATLFLGAIFGGADGASAIALEPIGALVGELIQISDDLNDAMAQPAQPDWQRQRNNLPIRYAITATIQDFYYALQKPKTTFFQQLKQLRTLSTIDPDRPMPTWNPWT